MGEFKIITNGLRFRILRKRKFWKWEWWSPVRDHQGFPLELYSEHSAKDILVRLEESRKAEERGWSDL